MKKVKFSFSVGEGEATAWVHGEVDEKIFMNPELFDPFFLKNAMRQLRAEYAADGVPA